MARFLSLNTFNETAGLRLRGPPTPPPPPPLGAQMRQVQERQLIAEFIALV